MKKNIFFALCLGIFLLLPNPSSAECTDLAGFTSFSLQGANTVILYSASRPVASFDVQSCNVEPTSNIGLIKSYVCDGDEILIDGSRCTIMEIKPLGP